MRLKTFVGRNNTLGVVGRLLGVSEDSARTLATIGAVRGDRRVQAAMSEIHAADLRSKGALVLAPTPIR